MLQLVTALLMGSSSIYRPAIETNELIPNLTRRNYYLDLERSISALLLLFPMSD